MSLYCINLQNSETNEQEDNSGAFVNNTFVNKDADPPARIRPSKVLDRKYSSQKTVGKNYSIHNM